MSGLQRANAPLKGKCFENCLIAVLGLNTESQLHYVLGFVTPPGYDSVPHAWLHLETENGPVYIDPTLQDSSPLWQFRSGEFAYDMRYRMSKAELLLWFRNNYRDRKFSEIGIPEGLARGPIINADGEIE